MNGFNEAEIVGVRTTSWNKVQVRVRFRGKVKSFKWYASTHIGIGGGKKEAYVQYEGSNNTYHFYFTAKLLGIDPQVVNNLCPPGRYGSFHKYSPQEMEVDALSKSPELVALFKKIETAVSKFRLTKYAAEYAILEKKAADKKVAEAEETLKLAREQRAKLGA